MIPKAGRGKSLPAPMPRLMPNIEGWGMASPPAPPSSELLLNQMASTPAAKVNVTTPSMRPRTRKAGNADHHAHDCGNQRGEQRRNRERDPPRRGEGAQDVGRDAGQRQLRQRDLPRVPRHHDQRQGDHRRDEAGVEPGPVVPAEEVDGGQTEREPDHRRRDAPVRTRRPPQRRLEQRAPAGDGAAPEGQDDEDQHEGYEFARSGGERRVDSVDVDGQRLEAADGQARP